MKPKSIVKLITGTALVATIITGSIAASEYMDIAGFGDKGQAGRTKNSIASVVTGIVAHKLYTNSEIDVEVEKFFWPDATISGQTKHNSIDTYMGLALTSNKFNATAVDGNMKGRVDKSEFDWKVQQTSPHTYKIARAGPKFNSVLTLDVQDGRIYGKYDIPGPNMNWDIEGSYTDEGDISIDLSAPLTLDMKLSGKITEK